MSLGPITSIVPRPQRIMLGTDTFLIGEFRLIDLATLQSFLDERHANPLDPLRHRVATEGTEHIQKPLVMAYAEADSVYKYVHGSYFPTDEEEVYHQAVHFVLTALRQYQPDISELDVLSIASGLEPGQMSKLNSVVWGINPVEEIGKLLGFELRQERSSNQWPKLIVETMTMFPAYKLADIYQLTLSELHALRSGGAPKQGPQWRIRGSMKEAAAERRAWFQRIMANGDDVIE